MTMRTATALLLIALVSGCASDGDALSEASDSGGSAGSAEPRGLECDGGSESAVADYFPNAPQNQAVDSVGEASPEEAALQLLTFGRAFDPDAFEVNTSEDGHVTYSDAQGDVVAEVVVVPTRTDGFVATEMQVCKSALGSRSETPEVAAGEGVNFAAVRPGSGEGMDALAHGVLRANSGTGCIWLEGDDGQPIGQLLLQGDYEVVFEDEPVIVRRDGEVVAEVGQQVQVAGGYSQATAGVEGCPVSTGVWLGRFE